MEKQALGARISRELDKIGPNLRKIMGNMGWLFVDHFVRMGMGLFVGVWVARYLGPVQFGSLNFALAFIALFATATTLGLEGIVIRELLHLFSSVATQSTKSTVFIGNRRCVRRSRGRINSPVRPHFA